METLQDFNIDPDDVQAVIEEFGGEAFKQALLEARLNAGNEDEDVEAEHEGETGSARTEEAGLPPKVREVLARRTRAQAAATGKASVGTGAAARARLEGEAEEEAETETSVGTRGQQAQPFVITEEHVRQWLGDEYDTLTDAQKKVAYAAVWLTAALQYQQQQLQAVAQALEEARMAEEQEREEDELVEQIATELERLGARAGLDEDELSEVVDLMAEEGITKPATAIELYLARKYRMGNANILRPAGKVSKAKAAAAAAPATTETASEPGLGEESVGFRDWLLREGVRLPGVKKSIPL